MESEINVEERLPAGLWKTPTPVGCSVWVDDWDKNTVPLLEGEAEPAVDLNLSIDWPGPWNTGEKNLFPDEEWKPLTDPLLEGERHWDNFVDTDYLLNIPVNLTPVPKVQKFPDLFEQRKDPKIELSHTVMSSSSGCYTMVYNGGWPGFT